jgi:hypothetical protein
MANTGVGGSNGPGESYVHPVYRNMNPKKASTIDKLAVTRIKNKGKASDIVKNMKEVQEDIKSFTRIKGTRSTGEWGHSSEPKYRGARGGFSGGGSFLENLK